MAKTADKIEGLFGRAGPRARVGRGEEVELHLDTGEVLEATISSLRSPSADKHRITAHSKRWSRWAGTPDDVLAFVNKATARLAERSAEDPAVRIAIALSGNDEEHYFDVPTFGQELCSEDPGTPGARLRDIRGIEITLGPTEKDALKATASFSRSLPTPGVVLATEGADREVVRGLAGELAVPIAAGRPRIPALPGPAQMFVGGLGGIAYFLGLSSIDWSFMPDGWPGDILFALLYLSGFIGLIYALTGGLNALLPPLTLVPAGKKTQSQQWARRVLKLVGTLCLAAFPFVLQQIFGE
jgi:hypothetical protein